MVAPLSLSRSDLVVVASTIAVIGLFTLREARRGVQQTAAADLWVQQSPTLPSDPAAMITPGRVPWLIDLAAAGELPDTAIPMAAAATRALLHDPIPEEEVRAGYISESLAGLEPWRSQQARRCGDCAPPPAALPPRVYPGTISLSGQAERLRRSTVPVAAGALPTLAASIRQGEQASDEVWQTPAQAGLAAFELGRRGDADDLEILLVQSVDGPTASDRLAALYAASHLATPQALEAASQQRHTAEGASRVSRIQVALDQR